MDFISEIDKAIRNYGIDFDSSINLNNKLLYFKQGLLKAEVEIVSDAYGQPCLKVFETTNKLRSNNV